MATASEQYDEITDKIPVKPVGAVEGTSYFLVILAGLAVAGGAAYAVRRAALLVFTHPTSGARHLMLPFEKEDLPASTPGMQIEHS